MLCYREILRLSILSVLAVLLSAGILHASSVRKDSRAEALMKKSDYNELVRYIHGSGFLRQKDQKDQQLYYLNMICLAHLRLRNVDSALMYGRMALSASYATSDSTLIVSAWKSASYAYNNAGKLDSALIYTKKMMEYGVRNADSLLTRNALTSYGTILSQNKRYQEAKDFFSRACVYSFRLKDSISFSGGLFNIALNFLNLGTYDSCIWYLDKAATWAERKNQQDVLVYIYGSKADCYQKLHNEKERKKYLLLANAIAGRINNHQFMAMGYSHLAQGELEAGRYREAILYGTRALKSLEIQPYPVLKLKIDSMMWIASKANGDYAAALRFLENFLLEKSEMQNERQAKQLNELLASLQMKEKDLTIKSQQLELTEKAKTQQRLFLVIIIVGLLVLGQALYIFKSRTFRKQLFRKEQAVDAENQELKEWLEWKLRKEKMTEGQVPEPGSSPENQEIREIAQISQRSLFAELRDLFDKQKLYLDPELNLKTVIKLLGTNQKYLYLAITENSDQNFRAIINRYRVDEAKRVIREKVKNGGELNLSEIYSQAGFNSTASFYRSFRAVTGLTPKEYLQEIRRLPGDDHLPH